MTSFSAASGNQDRMHQVSERRAEGWQLRVVIVGAVFDGLTGAKNLANTPVNVTLVDREKRHLLQPFLYLTVTADITSHSEKPGRGRAARFNRCSGDHLIPTKVEHKCVLECFHRLAEEGFRVTYLDVSPDGLTDLDQLAAAFEEATILVSIIGVHNEVGVIRPLAEIGALCRERVHGSTDYW